MLSVTARKMHQQALHHHSRCTVLQQCSSICSISMHHSSTCIPKHSSHTSKLSEHSCRPWVPARQPLQPLPSQRHSIRVAAAPDWKFDFDKNPQNTQNPKVPAYILRNTAAAAATQPAPGTVRHSWAWRCFQPGWPSAFLPQYCPICLPETERRSSKPTVAANINVTY